MSKIPYAAEETIFESKIEALRLERLLLEKSFSELDLKCKNISEMDEKELGELIEENEKLIKDIKELSLQVELVYGKYQLKLEEMLSDSSQK